MVNNRRRTFIKGGAAAITLAAPLSRVLAASSAPDIVDVHGKDRAVMVRAAIDALGGIGAFVKKGDRVAIKANAGFAKPQEWGVTTHPDVVLEVAKLCVEAGAARVEVVENPTLMASKCFKRCGLHDAFKALPQVKLVLIGDGDDFVRVKLRKGKSLKRVEVARAVLAADVFINIPAAKQHSAAGVTFGLKNHMGLIKDRMSFHTVLDLHQAIADLATVLRPHLTVLDATRALITGGPAGPGDLVEPWRVVAGRDIVAVDAYGLGLALYNNKKMRLDDAPHIALAASQGVGQADVSALRVKKIDV